MTETKTVGQRIKYLRTEKLEMSQVAFADAIGVSKQTLYKYENDIITNIPSDKISKIAEICNVSPAYLMGWELPKEFIEADEREANVIQALRDNPDKYPATNRYLNTWDNEVDLPEGAIPFTPRPTALVPLLGSVNCGSPLFAEQNIEEYIETPVDEVLSGETFFWLRAKGNSMTNVGIHEGDLLYIRKQDDVDSGNIAVVAVNGDNATLKRVVKKDNAIILQPENPDYDTQIFVGDEMKEITIVGRLMKVEKRF